MVPYRFLEFLAKPDQRRLLWWLYGAVLASSPSTALTHLWSAFCQAFSDSGSAHPEQSLLPFVCFALFALLYYRFAAGDYRYMWQRYAHLSSQRSPEPGSTPQLSETRCCLDLLFLTGQAALLQLVANNLLNPEEFFPLYGATLSVNVCWLAFNYIKERRVQITHQDGRFQITFEYLECHKAGVRWAVNNILAIAMFFVLSHLHFVGSLDQVEVLWASAGICFLNSVLDIAATYWHYFPTLLEKAPVNRGHSLL